MFNLLKGDRGGQILMFLLIAATILVPYLNLFTPQESPYHVSTLTVTVIGKYLAFALLALSVDLVWGYMGILSLGHGAFLL